MDESQYRAFVDSRTSRAGRDLEPFLIRLCGLERDLNEQTVRLLMSGIGLVSEAGELLDLLKKVFFHERVWSDDTRIALIKELGDVEWYAQNMRIALGVSREDVLALNVEKLSRRYPTTFLPDGQEYREEAQNSQE